MDIGDACTLWLIFSSNNYALSPLNLSIPLIENVRFEGHYWASDSQYVYFYDWFWRAANRSVYRVNIRDKPVEKIATVGGRAHNLGFLEHVGRFEALRFNVTAARSEHPPHLCARLAAGIIDMGIEQ